MYYYKRIKELREDRDLSQTDIANVLEIKQVVYSRYERGERELPIHLLIKLCRIYNVSADYILELNKKSK
ncbi:MAG TPA: helix-turn-helix transcriptional regulator [Oscillospiraceae bacterium]|nr:helix-turn-helix transcriptional regulator [Oscillospiraceae bacterium]